MLKSLISRFQNPYPVPRTISIISFPFSSRRKNDSDSDSDSGFIVNKDHDTPPKLFVVQPRLRPDSLLRLKLSEALNLANSLEEKREDGSHSAKCEFKKNDEGIPNYLVVQNPSSKSLKADKFFGPGTVENIKCHIKAFESQEEIDAVFVNAILSGIQQRNLEMAWKKPVMDRVGLIIEIFHAHAETKEAKLQSELAALMYKRSRLVRVRGPSGRLTFGTSGDAEVVSARGRGSGGRGFISGAGETELQLQRRRIQERKTYLLSQIEEVRRTRAVQRSARKRHGSSYGKDLSTVAIVGYTNAGKSTLVSTLSGTDVYSDDRLFATVDPRLRSVILPSGRKALLSDTVGFISDLPVQLVEAFHATLEEVVEADLLVHVLDASAPNMDDQRATVLEVLEQIGVTKEKVQNMVEVWNKIDLIDEDKRTEETHEGGEHLIECEDQTVSEDTSLNVSEEANIDTVLEDEDESSNDEEQTNPERVLRDDEFINGKHQNTEKCIDVKKVEHVKTSAVMRIGLQELLEVIDDKLNKQQSVVTKSYGPFDRKWRASYTAENEKVASE